MYLQTFNIKSIKSLDLSNEYIIKTCIPIIIIIQQIENTYVFKARKNHMEFVRNFDDIDCLICFLEDIKTCGTKKYFSRKNYSYFF